MCLRVGRVIGQAVPMQDGRAFPSTRRGQGRQSTPLLGMPQLLGDPPLPDSGRSPQGRLRSRWSGGWSPAALHALYMDASRPDVNLSLKAPP